MMMIPFPSDIPTDNYYSPKHFRQNIPPPPDYALDIRLLVSISSRLLNLNI